MPWQRRVGIQRAYPLEEKRFNKWPKPVMTQPKLDGERCRAVIGADGYVTLLTSEENIFYSVPHIKRELEASGLKEIELDGELCRIEMTLPEIQSVVGRTVNLHPDHEKMQYHIFDVVREDLPQVARTAELVIVMNSLWSDTLVMVDYDFVNTWDECIEQYRTYLSQGYEGIICRHIQAPYKRTKSTFMMKFKPKECNSYLIIGWNQEKSQITGELKDSLGSFVCVTEDGEEFSVGSGLKQDQRKEFWERKGSIINYGMKVLVEYQYTGKEGRVPRDPIFRQLEV